MWQYTEHELLRTQRTDHITCTSTDTFMYVHFPSEISLPGHLCIQQSLNSICCSQSRDADLNMEGELVYHLASDRINKRMDNNSCVTVLNIITIINIHKDGSRRWLERAGFWDIIWVWLKLFISRQWKESSTEERPSWMSRCLVIRSSWFHGNHRWFSYASFQ